MARVVHEAHGFGPGLFEVDTEVVQRIDQLGASAVADPGYVEAGVAKRRLDQVRLMAGPRDPRKFARVLVVCLVDDER